MWFSFSKLSIKYKFTLIVMVVTTSALIFFSALASVTHITVVRDSLVRNLQILSRTLTDTAPEAFKSSDREALQKLLFAFRNDPDIEMAVFFGPDNLPLARYVKSDKTVSSGMPELPGPDGFRYVWEKWQMKINVTYPVVIDNGRLGTISIVSGVGRLYDYFMQFGGTLLLSMAGILIWTYFLTAFIHKPLGRTLADLLAAARRVTEKADYNVKVKVRSNDEVGKLAESFNSMLEAIIVRDDEIKEHRDNLESVVAERTIELRQKRDEALSAANAKSEFLANMSHEIRTPMNGVIGVLSLLQEAKLSEEHKKLLETASRSADSLLMIINDILDFSKIDAGMVEFEEIPFDLRELMEEVALLFVDSVDSSRTDLICFVPTYIETGLIGDPTRLRQVLGNLLSNAIKFTEHGEVVLQVGVVEQDDTTQVLKFQVRDTGVGIPGHVISRLFEKFTQADGSTSRKYGGTGLGLSVCKQLVELQGGEIGVESAAGIGATFWFTLPVKIQQVKAPETIAEIDKRFNRCIVVDDNETNRMVLSHYLADSRMTIDMCIDGRQVLDVMHKKSLGGEYPDLIILDHHMPHMDGLELASIISKKYPDNLPTMIMLTSGMLERQQMIEAGIDGAIYKPIRKRQLFRALGPYKEPVPLSEERQADVEISFANRLEGKVLLVDDEIINQKVGCTILQKFGLEVELAVNGKEAVRMARQRSYDLILMDIQMPEMSGYMATERIRNWENKRQKTPVPIIAMTANAMESAKEKCLAIGMDDFIAKPIRPDSLYTRLQPWFKEYTLEHELEDASGHSFSRGETTNLWDLEQALKLVGGDEELLTQMIHLFLERAEMMVDRLEEALQFGDAAEVNDRAHAFKGAVNHFCAQPLILLAKKIERKGKINDLSGASQLFSELQHECDQLCDSLQLYLKRLEEEY